MQTIGTLPKTFCTILLECLMDMEKAERVGIVKKFAHSYVLPLRQSAMMTVISRPLYDDMPDQMRHWQCIRSLADEMHQPVHVVRLLYENALMHLKPNAKIQNFLPIFVSKCLKRRTVFSKQPSPAQVLDFAESFLFPSKGIFP